MVEKLSAQSITQSLFALRNLQILTTRKEGSDHELELEIENLVSRLKTQILLWGGY